jgi:uncharacterized membrane protein YukC
MTKTTQTHQKYIVFGFIIIIIIIIIIILLFLDFSKNIRKIGNKIRLGH